MEKIKIGFGNKKILVNTRKLSYFDYFRGERAMTEFAEFCQALRNYDTSQNPNNLIEILLEAGDILFQSLVLDFVHQGDPQYPAARTQMDRAMSHVEEELKKILTAAANITAIAPKKRKFGI